MSYLDRMVFVTGFARGGTSWLRTCIASHPEFQSIPHEMPIFREHHADHAAIDRIVTEAIESNKLTGPRFVNKAPANAPYVGKTAGTLPEAKFVFIIRDPRDVFISHKRGNQEWMRGANSTVDGCMTKTQRYYAGFEEGKHLSNLMLVRYEDLHQDFLETMRRVYEFLGVSTNRDILNDAAERCNFWSVASRHRENRDAAARKGVVGDWVNFLEPEERRWYQRSAYWTDFMRRHEYDWSEVTYESILRAMREGGVESLDENDVLASRLHEGRPSLLLLHDIDLLKTEQSRNQVLALAKIEGELGLASVFNFLPLDDMRYAPLTEEEIIGVIREVQRLAPRAAIGIHLNAAERFFPRDMPETATDDPAIADRMRQAIAYLHKQLDDYARHGIIFRMGTAHGYGRPLAKEPNNASEIFRNELAKRGVRLFDKDLRVSIQERAADCCRLSDVGGALTTKRFPSNGRVDDPETYRRFPAGRLINFLIHPGNYDIAKSLTLGLRTNLPDREELASPRPFVEPPETIEPKRRLFDLGRIVRGITAGRR